MANRPRFTARQAGFFVLGCLMVVLGVIGAVLPLMPTTVFLILAAWCFGRSSPRLEAWLLNHPRFGPTLRAWRKDGAIPLRAKYFAVGGITLGYALFFWGARPGWLLAIGVLIPMAAIAMWIVTRPLPRN
ncbi:inner membrane protein ybaN (plasmid) [Ketogulonicigenium robustum]|uniref:Inner membrane protein ybaN n=1 Tax=Ketogulonicigenium robustum TaxID=92947 RepID=A0A1W6P3D8_9RHOB|nr:YbaN family protein [Ketogulonicigenium robustum]ARO15901.1 inner membrane protein ybaN [Ketogulonicigenium robustum]